MTQPSPGPADPPIEPNARRTTRWVLVGLIVAVGISGALLAAGTGRKDSALLFVGVPLVLALAVTLLVRPSSGSGLAFTVVTVVLLVISALLREAAVCVLMAAPLIYGITALTLWATGRGHRRSYAVVPVIGLLALEGLTPGARVLPTQTASATTTFAQSCDAVQARLAHPTIDPAQDRGWLLALFPYPTPSAATGNGLTVGSRWSLAMPQGALETMVSEASEGRLAFTVTADHSHATRWVEVKSGTLAWQPSGSGCAVTAQITWVRKLDPSWYFGPVNQAFVSAGTHAFLESLGGAGAP